MTTFSEQKPKPNWQDSSWITLSMMPIAVTVAFLILWLPTESLVRQPHEFSGFLLESPIVKGKFTLQDHTGAPVAFSDFEGKVTLIYYGYTYCPDVCPSTLSEMSQMMEELGRRADEVQVIMVSVDPERDTPEKLNEYVTYFHPDFIGLTGTEEQLVAATAPYGIFYEKHDGSEASGYLIDHSAGVLLFDEKGYLKLMFPYAVRGEDMAEDVQYFLGRW